MAISRQSTTEDVSNFLKENDLNEAIEEFEGNEVDGEDFFDLDLKDICQLIPRLKIRKRFLAVWSKVTKETFDTNGMKCTAQPPPLATLSPIVEGFNFGSETTTIDELSSPELSDGGMVTSTHSNSSKSSKCSPRRSLDFESPVEVAELRRSPRKHEGSPLVVNSRSSASKTDKGSTIAADQESSNWLHDFVLPTRWEPDVEQGLKKESLNPAEKNVLVRQLCATIMAHTDYPESHARTHIALLLVKRYPCLKGSYGAGHQIWAKKIEERILNVRRRAARNEKRKYEEEVGTKLPKGKAGRKKTKSPKTTSLPAIPDGETEETLESQRKQLLEMSKRHTKDLQKVRMLMDNTFAYRRRNVLLNCLRVWKLLGDYPFLKDNKGIEMKAELGRILERINIVKETREIWESKRERIFSTLKKCNNSEVQKILMELEDCDISDEKEMENRCIMAALPCALGEKKTHKQEPGELFWEILTADSEVHMQDKIKGCSTPKLLSSGSLVSLNTLSIIAEGMVVAKFKPNSIFNAVFSLIAAYYVFNAEYPKGASGHSKNVFLFLESALGIKPGKCMLPMGVENFLSSMNV